MLVIRTPRPAWKSLPGRGLLYGVLVVSVIDLLLPYGPWAGALEVVPLSGGMHATHYLRILSSS